MANKILVFIEQRNSKIKKASLETAFKGSQLAKELNIPVEAVIIGDSIKSAGAIGNYGITKLYHIKNEALANYSTTAYSKALTEFIRENQSGIILFPNTAMGKDLAPFVAAKLDSGLAMDCVELNISEGNLKATRPVYAGKALLDIELNGEFKIFTLRPNVFAISETSSDEAEVVEVSPSEIDLGCKVIELKKSEGKLDVAEADIIVSGGRGMKGPENFGMIEEMAELLNGACGASRAVVDAGWRPHSEQVGQTGKTVSPNLYIAIGISGAIQHLAGMSSSKYIVAINKDKEAPIFQVADYGIAGDAFEIVPKLIEELKKTKEN